ncbi:hypothetical protein [Rhizorhabdus argentea]|uniref:hypothetical protein n=1 Tax=Rhizorhabdus argentea TaxID=1387174 RepID=UPI0030ED712A
MTGISPAVALMLLGSIGAQVLGIFLLPMTRGLTQPLPTLAAAAAFLLGIGLMARIAHAGVGLSSLMPILAATIPLAAIAVGILAYGEAASLAKVATLVTACLLVGVASTL